MEKSEIKAMFRRIESHMDILSPYQAELIKGLKKYYAKNNKLSPKQIDALISIDNLVYVR